MIEEEVICGGLVEFEGTQFRDWDSFLVEELEKGGAGDLRVAV